MSAQAQPQQPVENPASQPTTTEASSWSSCSCTDVVKYSADVCKTISENSSNYAKHLTNFKRDYVFWHATTNVRLIELGATTLLISLLSWKGNVGVTRTFRNAVLGYFSVGFVLVPEIYNPVINLKKA